MANITNYVDYQHAASGFNNFEAYYTTTFSGSYVTASTGETINALTATDANGLELSGQVPNGAGATGYPLIDLENFLGYQCIYTALSNGSFTVRFYVLDTGAELASGAYPAAITGGQLTFRIRHRV